MGNGENKNRVLILDDEEPLLRLLGRLVERAGGVPLCAPTMAAARDLMKANEFACALIDRNLPDGNGLDLIPELVGSPARTDVVVVTAHAEMTGAIFALRSGATDYLIKPFSTTLVVHRIEQIFERRRLLDERTRMQGQLVRADRMVALGTLAAGVAHELANPLSLMSLSAESAAIELPRAKELARMLGGNGNAAAPAAQLLQAIETIGHRLEALSSGVARMTKLAGDLKSYARGGYETRNEVDVNEVVRAALAMGQLEVQRRARLALSLGHTPKVMAVRERLEQVVLNLLVNAVQALGAPSDEHVVEVTTTSDAQGDAVIEVVDTGVGMTPEVMERLFEPFFTTKPVGEGTGLGLSISNDIVTGFGGLIEAESVPGKGSTFRVRLPAAGHAPLRRDVSPPPAEAKTDEPPARGRVLVVDDEPNVARLLQEALASDHDVVALTQARTALQQLSSGAAFDVIVCDLVMPGMTGMELYAEVEKVAPKMAERILFLTGATHAHGVQAFLHRVQNQFLEKPFQLKELKDAVSGVIRAHPRA